MIRENETNEPRLFELTPNELLVLLLPHIRRVVKEELANLPQPELDDELWDMQRLTDELGVTRQTVGKYVESGFLTDVGPGRRILVKKSQVLKLKSNN